MGIYESNGDFNKYKIFYAVAECKSFSKASEVLYISQPAISYSIKELEEKLNTKLFLRNRNGIKLTDDGEKLLFYVQQAFNNIVKAEQIITEREEEVMGLIRVGIYSNLSLFMLPKMIKKFKEIYPDAKFSLFQSSDNELKEKLKHKELDFIIAQYPVFLSDNGFNEEIICELETCFYGTQELYKEYDNKDLSIAYPIILPFNGYDDIDSLEKTLKRNKILINNSLRCYASETSVELVKNGLGIGWGLKKLIEKELEKKELYEINIGTDTPYSIFSIVYDERFLNKTSKEFLTFFKSSLKDIL